LWVGRKVCSSGCLGGGKGIGWGSGKWGMGDEWGNGGKFRREKGRGVVLGEGREWRGGG